MVFITVNITMTVVVTCLDDLTLPHVYARAPTLLLNGAQKTSKSVHLPGKFCKHMPESVFPAVNISPLKLDAQVTGESSHELDTKQICVKSSPGSFCYSQDQWGAAYQSRSRGDRAYAAGACFLDYCT